MSRERAWVEAIKPAIEGELGKQGIVVATSFRLPYAFQISSYKRERGELSPEHPATVSHGYQTDLLIAEHIEAGAAWVPRVVVEFKLGKVTTHDALTYSTKAATHKNVHPYLRYGIVIGGYNGPVPRRLLRYGHHFDFMATIAGEALKPRNRVELADLLAAEVNASRTISKVLSEKSDIRRFHRKLEVG